MEADEARDLIEEAIEETERHDSAFRNRVSLLVGLFAVLLAVVHTLSASAQRESLLTSIEASDTFAYMQAKTIRESLFRVGAEMQTIDADSRAAYLAEAARLRQDDKAGHGIDQLRDRGNDLRRESAEASGKAEGYELGETALQVAIVLLSIALIAQSRRIVQGATALAAAGVTLALLTALGLPLF